MPARYTFGRMSDAQVLQMMDDLLVDFEESSATIDIGDLSSFTLTRDGDGVYVTDGDDSIRDVLSHDSYLITKMSWKIGSVRDSATYYRQKVWDSTPGQTPSWQDGTNPYLDSLEVRFSLESPAVLLALIKRHIDMSPPALGSSEAGNAIDQSQTILNKLNASILTLVEHTAERQKDLDETRLSISQDAERRISEEKDAIKTALSTVEHAYLEKEKALAEREKELDDRANTHVRRDFAKQMAALSDTRLSSNLLSRSTYSFAIPLAVSLLPILFLGWIISNEIGHITTFNNNIADVVKDISLKADQKTAIIDNINYQILYSQIRIALQSLGIAALVWFSLRLASSRYSVVSQWERDLHKFRLDTERAGFLVEGDLEARKVNQEGLPNVLLESFSRNLFAASDGVNSATSSEGLGGALNALLGQAAKVRVGPDGVNVEIEGKGIRRAKKLIEDDA